MDLKVGIGLSDNSDSQAAGRSATQQAFEKGDFDQADFLLVFADSQYNHQLLLQGIQEKSQSPMIGSTTAGEISPLGPTENSVVVIAFKSSNVNFTPCLGQNLQQNPISVAQQAAQTALDNCPLPEQKKSFLIFPDGLAGNHIAILQGVQNTLGENFEIIGASASDQTNFKTTYQYFNYQAYQNSVVGALVSGDIVTGIGVQYAWQPVGNILQCTKSENNIVYELNNQPALEAYRLYLGQERSKDLPGISFQYPLGIMPQPDQQIDNATKPHFPLRTVISINEENQSLMFNTAIPQGTNLTMATASRQNIIHQTQAAAQQAQTQLAGARPLFILNFFSLGHRLVLGHRTNESINTVKTVFGSDTPIAGFFSYSEIGPLDKTDPDLSISQVHNQSNLIWVLGTNLYNQ